jgi:carboxylesterase type B
MLASQLAAANPTDIVQTEQGAVRGHSSAAVMSFKGVPFAAPPVGALRWHETMPPAPWKGIRDASAYGAPCAGRCTLIPVSVAQVPTILLAASFIGLAAKKEI